MHIYIQGGYHIPCHNWQHPALHMLIFHENVLSCIGKKAKWVYYEHLYYVFRILCKVDYESDKFIHAPTYIYNEVMRLPKLFGIGIVECE